MVCQKIKHVYRIVLSFRHSWTYTSRQLFNLTAGVDKSENIVAVPLRVHAVHSLIKKESVLYSADGSINPRPASAHVF